MHERCNHAKRTLDVAGRSWRKSIDKRNSGRDSCFCPFPPLISLQNDFHFYLKVYFARHFHLQNQSFHRSLHESFTIVLSYRRTFSLNPKIPQFLLSAILYYFRDQFPNFHEDHAKCNPIVVYQTLT